LPHCADTENGDPSGREMCFARSTFMSQDPLHVQADTHDSKPSIYVIAMPLIYRQMVFIFLLLNSPPAA
jgi:hypothetical protein